MKITTEQYLKASRRNTENWMDKAIGKPYDEKIYSKNQSITDKYNKQTRFNLFKFLNIRYSPGLKSGKKANFWAKMMFVSLFLYVPIIILVALKIFSLFISIPTTIGIILSLLLYVLYDTKYDTERMYFSYIEKDEGKMKQYIREQKLKRILKNKLFY